MSVGTYLVVTGLAIRMMGCCSGAAGRAVPEVYLQSGIMYGAISCAGWVLVMRARPVEDARLGLYWLRVGALMVALIGEVLASELLYWMMLETTEGTRKLLLIPMAGLAGLWLVRRYWLAQMAEKGWPYKRNFNGLCLVFALMMVLFFVGTQVSLVTGPKGDGAMRIAATVMQAIGIVGGGIAYMCVVFDQGLLAKHLARQG